MKTRIELDERTVTVLHLLSNPDVAPTEEGVLAAMRDRNLCGDLILDNRAPGRQLDTLERLGFIEWTDDVARKTAKLHTVVIKVTS